MEIILGHVLLVKVKKVYINIGPETLFFELRVAKRSLFYYLLAICNLNFIPSVDKNVSKMI